MNPTTEGRPPSPLRWFAHELRELIQTARTVWAMVSVPHRLALVGAVGVMVLGGVANTALPFLLGRIVNEVQAGRKDGADPAAVMPQVANLLALVAGFVLAREALQVFRRFLVERTCTKIERQLSVTVVSHLMRADLSRLTHEKVGALHGRIFRSVDGFMRLLRMSFLDFFPALAVGGLAVASVAAKQPWVGLAVAGVMPCSIALTVWQLVSQKRVRLKLMRVREELDGTVVEQLTGLDYIRVANTQAAEVRRVDRAAQHRRDEEFGHHVAMSFFGAGKAVVEGLFHVGVLGLAAYLVVSDPNIEVGDVLVFSMLYLSAMAPVNEVHRVIDQGHEASLQVANLRALLALPVDPSFTAQADTEPAPDDKGPLIRAENVRVEYRLPDGRARTALNGVDLEVYRGETIGIAGRSGCGKSTWLKVLMRLLHPTAGRVWVRGVPLEDVSRETISKLVGYVGQQPFLFAGTVSENIAYGSDGADPESVRWAAKRAGIHDEILAMPGGYDAAVAERGQNLSGGQRQRLALARVFLHDPAVLILDEATSALDTISERKVQAAIADARQDRTVILVAHRLSTFADADRIFVFDDGRIVETGSFEDLMALGGLFAELARCSELSPTALAPAADQPMTEPAIVVPAGGVPAIDPGPEPAAAS